MTRLKEFALNGLLIALVGLSCLLSARVWFPQERPTLAGAREPRVQPPPPAPEGQMPDVYRPERIYVQRSNMEVALLQVGSIPYHRVLAETQAILTGVRALAAPAAVDVPEVEEAEAVTVVLPVALTLSEWAQHWHWNTVGLRNPSMKIDRVVYRLGAAPVLDLSGPSGQFYRLGPLTDNDNKALQELVKVMEPELFQKFRPLVGKELPLRILTGVKVPDVGAMPGANLSVRRPEVKWEEVRYFPDLSVVRQIDEKDARSLTDGQRLVRLTASGVLEYRAADALGTAPELARAEHAAREWVYARGGWPQDLVMGWYVQEPGKTTLVFEHRSGGPFPVESAGGALTIQVAADRLDTAADRILSLRRLPDVIPAFGQETKPIIPPERAVQHAADELSRLFFFEAVREVHLAYLILPGNGGGNAAWQLEPVWVLQAGEERIYVAALPQSQLKPFHVGPRAP